MFRWGVMTLLAWIVAGLLGGPTPAVMWTVILFARDPRPIWSVEQAKIWLAGHMFYGG